MKQRKYVRCSANWHLNSSMYSMSLSTAVRISVLCLMTTISKVLPNSLKSLNLQWCAYARSLPIFSSLCNLVVSWLAWVFDELPQALMRNCLQKRTNSSYNLIDFTRCWLTNNFAGMPIHRSWPWGPEPYKNIWQGQMEPSGAHSSVKVIKSEMSRPIARLENFSLE